MKYHHILTLSVLTPFELKPGELQEKLDRVFNNKEAAEKYGGEIRVMIADFKVAEVKKVKK